ncbi:MAG: ergothioneine biosynthesis protein EgtB [Acidimicrobiales bacterium]
MPRKLVAVAQTSPPEERANNLLFLDYLSVRSLTERLAAPLSAEDQTVQSMPDASPTKWHRAHTSWFFETFVLEPNDDSYRCFNPDFRFLFNSYYEAVGPRPPRPERGLLSRPGAAEISRYRGHVDEAMLEVLQRTGALDPVVELGLHHEQQHQELLVMDIKHALSLNPLAPRYHDGPGPQPGLVGRRPATREGARLPSWWEHEGGKVDIGHEGNGFGFDNEFPRHPVHLAPFGLARYPVSNADWLAFMDDGGYHRPELWLSDGWSTVQSEGWEAPLYWNHEKDNWTVFTLDGRLAVDPAEPVCHVSYFEADAFAHWSGFRLPTEAEWETVAAAGWPQAEQSNLLDPQCLHPRSAVPGHLGHDPESSEAGPVDLYGHVWEWTASAYLPYPRFRANPGALGEYNGKFMSGQHVLRGGSCATPPGHIRPTYRNFFPPGSRWAFSGVRLAVDL